MEVPRLPWNVLLPRKSKPWGSNARARSLWETLVRHGTFDLVLLGALASVLLFWNLGRGSLADWDEAIYGAIATEMRISGNWITPSWNGIPASDKPPLYMWLTALVLPVFGTGEFAVRFWAAAFGVLGVILTYQLGRDLYGRLVGMISALILVSMPGYLYLSGTGMLDVPVAATSLLALLSFNRSSSGNRYLSATVFAFSLGFLFKLGMGMLPLPALLLYSWRKKLPQWAKARRLLYGVGLTMVILFLAFELRGPANGLGLFRVLGLDSNRSNIQPVGFYFDTLYRGLERWTLFAILGLMHLGYRLIGRRRDGDVLVGSWILVIAVIFFPSPVKLPWYVVSLYPALALEIGVLFKEFLGGRALASWLVLGGTVWRLFNLGFLQGLAWPASLSLAIGAAVCLVFPAAGLEGLRRTWRGMKPGSLRPLTRAVPGVLVGLLVMSTLHFPTPVNDNPDVKVLSEVAGSLMKPAEVLALYSPSLGNHENAAHFYSQRRVQNIMDPTEAASYLASPTSVFMLTTKSDLETIQGQVGYMVLQESGPWMLIRN